MAQFQEHAVILKRHAYRETDLIIVAFGLKRGKFSAVAKGVRRPNSRWQGRMNALSYTLLSLYHGRSPMDTVVDAELIDGFIRLPRDLQRLGWAMVLADSVDQLWQDHEASPESFAVLVAALQALNQAQPSATVGLCAGFRLLRSAGYGAEWTQCAGCHRAYDRGPVWIDVQGGDSYCDSCHERYPSAVSLRLGSLRSLQYWLAQPLHKFGQAEVKGAMREELTQVFFYRMAAIGGRPLKSHDFLRQVMESEQAP
jgi:DNA repair protein RecO (recombination protein O)